MILSRLLDLLTPDREPRWKRKPGLYHACPRCEHVASNAKWRIRSVEVEEKVGSYSLPAIYIHYVCPDCGKVTPIEEFIEHRLDNYEESRESFK